MRALPIATLFFCLTAALTGCAGKGACWICESPADAHVSGAVRDLISKSPSLGPPNLISVQAIHGVVYLRGVLSTPYQVAEAGSIAEQAPGVVQVRNLLSTDNSR